MRDIARAGSETQGIFANNCDKKIFAASDPLIWLAAPAVWSEAVSFHAAKGLHIAASMPIIKQSKPERT